MGLRDWGKSLFQKKRVVSAAHTVVSSTYQTVTYLCELGPAALKTGHAIVTHQPTRRVFKNLIHIAAYDVFPMVAVICANNWIQDAARSGSNDDAPTANTPGMETAINAALKLLEVATLVYSVRKKTQILIHSATVGVQAPTMFNGPEQSALKDVCKEAGCKVLDTAVKGPIRDNVAYWTIKATLAGVGLLPIPGGSTFAALLSSYHDGCYVLAVALPDLCYDHQLNYVRNDPLRPLSFALGQTIFKTIVEHATGLPSGFLDKSGMASLVVIAQMGVAKQLYLPAAPANNVSGFSSKSPIVLYSELVDVVLEIVVKGLLITIPSRFQDRQKDGVKRKIMAVFNLPWNTVNEQIQWLLHHPVAYLFLPNLVRAPTSDPIINPYLKTFLSGIVAALKAIEKTKERPVAKVARVVAPQSVLVSIVERYLGIPKKITELLLQLIGDEAFMLQLNSLRAFIEQQLIERRPLPLTHINAFRLRGSELSLSTPQKYESQAALPTAAQVFDRKEGAKTTLPSAEDVFRTEKRGVSSQPSAESVFAETDSNLVDYRLFQRKQAAQKAGVKISPYDEDVGTALQKAV